MAKVTGPLMSMDASGKFAGNLVFGKWKGRATVRQLVTPSNPQSAGQQEARNRIRVLGAGQHFLKLTAQKRDGALITDKAALVAAAPGGQAWNGYFVKLAIGTAGINYDAAQSAFAVLTAPQKTAWDAAAAALTPAIPAVAQIDALGVAGAPMTAGQVFFITNYALYVAGIDTTIPGAVPPVYA